MKVIIADDHALVREGISHTLKSVWGNVEVLEAGEGAPLLRLLEQHDKIDIVLMDLFMPNTDGFQMLTEINQRWPDVPLVILSASENVNYMRKAIDLGAAGYVPKSLSREVMLGALQLVRSGGVYIPPASLGSSVDDDESSGFSVDPNDPQLKKRMLQLTSRQKQVLKLLTDGMTNKEIATELGLSEYTIKIHITGIFKTLHVSNRTQAVIVARYVGVNSDSEAGQDGLPGNN